MTILLEMGITKEAACCWFTAGTACTLQPDIKLEFSACNIWSDERRVKIMNNSAKQ
jgi:hypothetical protein